MTLFPPPSFGIEVAMRRPLVLNHAIRLASALALLVSVMTSPIRPIASSRVSHPNHLRRNFGIPGKVPASHRPHIPVPSRVMQVKALSFGSKLLCMMECPDSQRIDLPRLLERFAASWPEMNSFALDRTSYAPRC